MKNAKLIEDIYSFYALAKAKKSNKLDTEKVYGPYDLASGRKIVIVVDKNGKKRTVSYPKFILEQHLGRKLDPDLETVDHWDSDYNNNDISNLRVVPRAEHSANDTRRVKLIKLKCKWCNKKFERSPRLLRDQSKKKSRGPFCSKSCAGKYSRSLQLKLIKKLPKQPFINSKYYKRKYINSNFLIELIKFASDKNILSLKQQLINLKPLIINSAQKILDYWEGENDPEFGNGGVCDTISNEIGNIIISSLNNVNVIDGGHDGDDHAYLIVYNDDEAYIVDIPHHVYEIGGGYSWKKIPNVILEENDVIIDEIERASVDD